MQPQNESIKFWLNAEFHLWEQKEDPIKDLEQNPNDLNVYCYKMPVAAYFSMTNSLRGQNESLRGYF